MVLCENLPEGYEKRGDRTQCGLKGIQCGGYCETHMLKKKSTQESYSGDQHGKIVYQVSSSHMSS